MIANWTSIVDDLQDYLARGITAHPAIYVQFLEALSERERTHSLSLLPIARLELYHLRLERKVLTRIKSQRAA